MPTSRTCPAIRLSMGINVVTPGALPQAGQNFAGSESLVPQRSQNMRCLRASQRMPTSRTCPAIRLSMGINGVTPGALPQAGQNFAGSESLVPQRSQNMRCLLVIWDTAAGKGLFPESLVFLD